MEEGLQIEGHPGWSPRFLGEDIDELFGGDQIRPRRHLTFGFRIIERHPGPPARGLTGEVDTTGNQQAETVYCVGGVPAPWVVAFAALGLTTLKVCAEPFPTEVRSIGDVPNVLHDTSLDGQPTFLPGGRRLGEQHLLRLLVDAHCLCRRLPDRGHPNSPVLCERADHVENNPGLA